MLCGMLCAIPVELLPTLFCVSSKPQVAWYWAPDVNRVLQQHGGTTVAELRAAHAAEEGVRKAARHWHRCA